MKIISANTTEDYQAAAGLFVAYQQALGVDLCFQGFDDELKQIPQMYGPPHGALLLAKEGASYIGCVALRPKGGGTCEMKRLYVTDAAKGKGLGRQLAEAIIEAGTALGYKKMVLDTLDTLTPALRLYESLGFTVSPPYYHNPLQGVIYLERAL